MPMPTPDVSSVILPRRGQTYWSPPEFDISMPGWNETTMTNEADPDTRAAALVAAMSLDEVLTLLHGYTSVLTKAPPGNYERSNGLGFVPGVARLGIPVLRHPFCRGPHDQRASILRIPRLMRRLLTRRAIRQRIASSCGISSLSLLSRAHGDGSGPPSPPLESRHSHKQGVVA
jgi:hypothetical protein